MTSQPAANSAVAHISAVYDITLDEITKLEDQLSVILNYNSEQLEEKMERKEYLELLAHLMYTLQSTTFLYSAVGQKQMPAEFNKVEDYFRRVRAMNEPTKQPPQRINKQATQRILKHQL